MDLATVYKSECTCAFGVDKIHNITGRLSSQNL